MKTLRILSLIAVCSFIFLLACKKDSVPGPTTNICDTLTRTQLLVQKDWQVDELYRNVSGTTTHFVKGGVNTTGTTYGTMRFHFNTNGTGTYIDEVGTSHTMDWSFVNANERDITLIIGPPFPNTFVWNMIEIKNNYLHTTSPYTGGLLSARYIQIP